MSNYYVAVIVLGDGEPRCLAPRSCSGSTHSLYKYIRGYCYYHYQPWDSVNRTCPSITEKVVQDI